MADLHDLAAPFALDALDADERSAFVDHLETCESCRAEVTSLLESSGRLAQAAAADPPPELKTRVLAAVDARIGANVVPLARQRRFRVAAIAAAAALLAIVGTAGLLRNDAGPSAEDVLAAADATPVTLSAEGFEAVFTYSLTEGAGVFASATLPALGGGETYELWLIDDDGAAPAGLFVPAADGTSIALVEDVRPGRTLGLTIEPAGGSPQPTGNVLLTAPVS